MKITTYTYIMMILLTIISVLGGITFLLLLKLGADQPHLLNDHQRYFFKIAAGISGALTLGCGWWWWRRPN